MMKQKTFSIVTVNLDSGKDLSDTVGSVLDQKFSDFELIIKDGLSRDGSLDELPKDSRIHLIKRKDTGIYDAMNQGIKASKGEYIHFLNAGDMYTSENSLLEVKKFIVLNKFPEIIYTYFENNKMSFIHKYPESLKRHFLFRRNICHQALFIKAKMFETDGLFNSNLKICADRDFLLKMLFFHKAKYKLMPYVAISYKGSGISESDSMRKVYRAELDCIRKTYFSTFEYLFFKLIHEASLYRLRVYVLNRVKCSNRLLKLYGKLANFINSF